MDHLYEIKGAARIIARPFVWTARVYVLGLKTVVGAIRGKVDAPITVVGPVPRPARNYSKDALLRARTLFPSEFIAAMKQIGVSGQDPLVAHLRAIPVAIVSQSFDDIWDSAMDDERLSESEKQSLAVHTLEMLEKDLILEGLL